MKNFTLLLKMTLLVVLISFTSLQLKAQHEILVPSQANFYDVIIGDTIADGSRRDPLAIYMLKRGDVYKLDRPMFINFNLTLIGEEGNDATTMPPVIVPQKSEASQEYPFAYIII